MPNPQEFLDERWPEIEKLAVPIDELIEEVRINEAHSGALSSVLGHKNKEGEASYAEIERLLRLVKQQVHSLNISLLVQKIDWLEHQIREGVHPAGVIVRLVDIVGKKIAYTYVLKLSEGDADAVGQRALEQADEQRPTLSTPTPPDFEEAFLHISDVSAEKMRETGYALPSCRLDRGGQEIIHLIQTRLEDILWPTVEDDEEKPEADE